MYHLIEFTIAFVADLEVSPKQPLERLRIRAGELACANLRPYVVETDEGLVEVADLYFDDGAVARLIPYEWFCFVE
jgi:hypothetical protein